MWHDHYLCDIAMRIMPPTCDVCVRLVLLGRSILPRPHRLALALAQPAEMAQDVVIATLATLVDQGAVGRLAVRGGPQLDPDEIFIQRRGAEIRHRGPRVVGERGTGNRQHGEREDHSGHDASPWAIRLTRKACRRGWPGWRATIRR